ncbi:MAG: hypothetical protein JNM31_09795 [Flavobacteriales bacterium]|nr:hypothetical protein [Flavobacteriales bacterium]
MTYRRLIPALSIPALLLAGLPVILVLSGAAHPEQRIAGAWEEVLWTYEKADPAADGVGPGTWFDEHLRHEVSKDLLIHESENWRFLPDGTVELDKRNRTTERLRWKLKGRGHILELVYDDDRQESYQIRSLTDEELVLQFNSDLVARGIVKIVFKKVPGSC